MTDNEILEGIYQDEVAGLTVLIDKYAGLVYKIVSEILSDAGNREDTEDCICEVFLAVLNNIDDVDLSRGSIRGFLGVIARRRAINLRCTLRPDEEVCFDEYTLEEMSEILEGEEVPEYAGLSDAITKLCLKEIAPEALKEEPEEETEAEAEAESELPYEEEEEEQPSKIVPVKSSGFGRVFKTLVAMVTLVAVITVGVIAYDKLSVPKYVPPTTTAPTTQVNNFNPLFSAITAGNEKLIEELIANSLLLSQEVLKFAVESADKISYDSIRKLAEEVRNKYGSTGLDPLLEGAIFGDFQSVEEKLKDKDESEMTPSEKLAWFFITNFSQ